MKIAWQKEKILIGSWLLVQVFLLSQIGINSSGEALRIIGEARHLLAGENLSSPVYYTYFTEILLVAISLKLKTGFFPLVIIQMAISLTALIMLFRSLRKLYNADNIAFAACIMLVICWPFQQFNTFIYTESLFCSFLIFLYCLLINNDFSKAGKKTAFVCIALLICITRPSGCLIAFAGLGQLLFVNNAINRKAKLALLITTTFLLIVLMNFLLTAGGGFNILKPFIENHIICDVQVRLHQQNFEGHSELTDLLKYIYNNPNHFFYQAMEKSRAFFGLTREWYSIAHNVFLIVFFYSLYIMSILAIFKWKRNISPSLFFNLLVILLFWASVLFSCDEWSNRFLLTLTPLLIVPAFLLLKKKKIN